MTNCWVYPIYNIFYSLSIMLDDDDELETIKSLAIGTLILVVFMMVVVLGAVVLIFHAFRK